MAKQNINVGTAANDKKGDSLRAAFQKVNANFTELYTELGLVNDVTLSLGAFEFAGSTISTTDSTAIVIDQATTISSNLTVGGDLLPQTALGGDLGSSTLPWRSLYISNNTIFLGGVPLGLDANGNLTVNGSQVTGGGVSSLVNSTKTVSLGSDGTLTVPAGGRISAASGYNLTLGDGLLLGQGGSIFNENEDGLYLGGQNSDAGTYIQIPGRTASENGESMLINHNWENASIDFSNYGGLWSFDSDGSLLIPGKIRVDEYLTRSNLTAYDQTSGYGLAGGPNAFSILQSAWPTANIDINVGAEITSPTFNTATVTSPVVEGPTSTWIIPIGTSNATAFTSTVNITYVVNKTWTFGNNGSITFPDATIQSTAWTGFSVAADDSTQRLISSGELVKFIGAGGITTSSDAEGYITITGSGGSLGNISNGTFPTTDPNSLVSSASAAFINFASDLDGAFGLGTNDGSLVKITTDGGASSFEFTADNGAGSIKFPDGTIQTTAAAPAFSFSVAADDSTQRAISNNELIKFIGAGGITTSSDAEGYITITGSGGSVSSLVNGAYTVSLGSTGTLTVPANGIITAPINQEFQLQAKDANSVLRNEINLDPNNGTYMSVWSDQTTSFSSADWGSGSWNNEEGLGAARFTDAQGLQNFWLTGPGSLGVPIEASINGGARTPNVFYDNNNGETYGVFLGLDAVPPGGQGTTVPITSLVFYYQTQSKINMDVDGGEILVDAQGLDLDLRTTLNLDLRANENLNLRGLGTYPVRIYTNGTTHMWEFDNTGSLTLPREGKIYGIGQGAASDRLGYISWDGNSSGDGSGYNTMRLVPDLTGLEAADQYIILDPTGGVPGHIHIRAGGTQDNSGAHLYLGGEHSHVKISAGLNPPVTVMANDNSWTFGTDGAITTSDAFTIKTPNGVPSSVSNINSQGGYNIGTYTNLATTGGTGTGLTVNASTAGNGYISTITINTAGTGYTNGDAITMIGGDGFGVTFTIGVAGTNSWAFGTSGDLTVPGDIKGTANTSIIIDGGVLLANVTVDSVDSFGGGVWRMFITSSAYPTLGTIVQVGDTATTAWGTPVTATITSIVQDIGAGTWALHTNQNVTTGFNAGPQKITINSTQVKTWTFGTDKSLTFPDGTKQTTAWTGTFSTLSVTGAVTAERFNTDQITVVGNRISTTVTNANLELECNGSGGVVINAIADATTASTVKSVGYLGLPQSATATDGTLAMSDAGKHIYVTTAGQVIAIPDNSSVAYPIGTTLTFIAGPSATTMLIVINQDTLRLAGSSSTGTRTLAANGMATAVKVAATTWYINGIGLT